MRASYYYSSNGDAGLMIFAAVLSLAAAVVMLIAQWKLFVKAGEKGWKCLIPFYNGFLWYKLTWSVGAWIALIVLALLSVLAVYVPVVGAVIGIVALVMYCVSCHKVSQAYGRSGGFTAGLIFLPVIFYLILAFGQSEYVGPSGVPAYRTAGGSGIPAESGLFDKYQEPEPAGSGAKLVWILTGVFLAVTVLFFGAELMLSMVNYRPSRGLFQSEFIGFRFFERLFAQPSYQNALLHSLRYSLLTAVLTVLAGFAGMGLGKAGNAGRTIGVTLGLLLAAVPRFFWETLIDLTQVPAVLDILCGALSWCGLSLAAGALLSRGLGGIRSALAVPAMFLMSFLSGQEGIYSLIANPLNRRIMRGDTFLYQTGLANGQYSYAAAGYITNALIGLPFAVGGCILLTALTRGVRQDRDGQRGRFTGAIPGIAAGVLLAAAGAYLAFGRGTVVQSNASVSQSVNETLVEMLFALPVGFGLFLLIQVLAGKKGAPGGFSRAAFLFAVFSLGQMWLTRYLLVSRAGLVNTAFPVALSWLLSPRALAVAVLLMLARPATMAECVRGALAAALMAIVLGIGDARGSVYYLSRANDVSRLLYRTFSEGVPMTATHPIAEVRTAVWGLVLLTAALPLGAGIALAAMTPVKE